MRKTLIALMIVLVPLVIVYVLLTFLPHILSSNKNTSLLEQKFSTEVTHDGVSTSGSTYSEVADKNLAKENNLKNNSLLTQNDPSKFYQDVKVTEQVHKSMEFYDVQAMDVNELKQAILELAPNNSSTDRKSITKVTYTIDWNLDTLQADDECKLFGATVVTNITTTMPRWIGIEDQGPEIQDEWNTYMDSVAKYEKRHDNIVDRISKEISNKIKHLPRERFCSELLAKVNRIGIGGIDKAENTVKRYQSETGGGRLLGVKMPDFADESVPSLEDIDSTNK